MCIDPQCLLHTPGTAREPHVSQKKRASASRVVHHVAVRSISPRPARRRARFSSAMLRFKAACKPPYSSLRTRTSAVRMARSIRASSRRVSSPISDGRGYRAQLASTVRVRLNSLAVRTTATTSILTPRSQRALQTSPCFAPHERSAVVVSWLGVDEDGPLRVQCDGQPEREVAPEPPERAPVNPLGKDFPLDPERLEGGYPVDFGRQPMQAGTFEHIVEREQMPHQYCRRRDPSATVVPHAERPVDPAAMDPADPPDAVDAGRLLLDGYALGDELADGASNLLVMAPEEARPLRPGEDAPVRASERDPLGPASGPTQGCQRPCAFREAGDRPACRRNESLLWCVHARNGVEPFEGKSTRGERHNVS